jgi:hypothetical protein
MAVNAGQIAIPAHVYLKNVNRAALEVAAVRTNSCREGLHKIRL